MGFGSANRVTFASVREAVKGITPATPAFEKKNYTGESINLNIGTVTSETIRDDRQISDLVRVSQDSAGSLNIEVQAGAYEDYLESALQGSFSTAIAVSTGSIDIVASTRAVACGAAGSFTNAVIGQWIKITGLVNSANNGWHKILTVTDTENVILTAGSSGLVDETLASGGAIAGKMLRNGTNTTAYTLEKLFSDVTVPTYFRYAGCEVSKMNLSFTTGSILKAVFDFIGRSGLVTETMIAGATYTNQSTNSLLDSVNSLGEIKEDDSAALSSFQSLELSLDNNSRGQEAIGTLGYVGITHGSVSITGSTSIYFESKATFEKYQNGTSFSMSFVLSSPDGDMVITLPKLKFSKMEIVSSAINTDVLASAEFTAIIDPVTTSMIQLDVA